MFARGVEEESCCGAISGIAGGGGTHLLLALVIWPLTTHPFRDRALFLLVVETPPTIGRSLRFFNRLHRNLLLILSPSCFTVCGHHLSPRIAIVFSLLSRAPNFSMPHSSIVLVFSKTYLVPPCIFHTLSLREFYSTALSQGHVCPYLSSLRLLAYLILLSGKSRSPTRNRSFSVFA